MANGDINSIRPLEGLQNISRITASPKREKRKKQQGYNGKKQNPAQTIDEAQLDEAQQGQTSDGEVHRLDYRA